MHISYHWIWIYYSNISIYSDGHNSLLYNDILSEICPQLDSRYIETIGDQSKSPVCSCIRTNEGISSLFPEIPSEPLGRVPPSSFILHLSITAGRHKPAEPQAPSTMSPTEVWIKNAHFLGPQNFCKIVAKLKKMRPLCRREALFFKNAPSCIWHGLGCGM